MSDSQARVDRLPPHSHEMEQGVLGCALLSPRECLDFCVERLGKGSKQIFYDLRHQTIFDALLAMHEKQAAIDVMTLREWLAGKAAQQKGAENLLEQVGGLAYLSGLPDVVPSAANVGYYLDIVREKALLRKVIHVCTDIVSRAFNNEGDVAQMMDGIERDLAMLTETGVESTEKHINQVLDGVVNDMEQWHYQRGSLQLRGLPTGPTGNYLDKILLGLRETHMTVCAARPGGGKSSWAMNVVEFLAKDYQWFEATEEKTVNEHGAEVAKTIERRGIPVGVFSLEMDEESLGYRLLFGRAGVDEAEFNQGYSRKGDWDKLIRARAELRDTNIYIDDAPAQSIGQIAAKARRWKRQYGIELFVLDYIQLGTSDNPRDDDRVRLNKISAKLVLLKKQLKTPWLVLAQMNRNIETGEVKRPPVLSDLKDSGCLEQDADKVIFLHKPDRKELDYAKEGEESEKELLDRVTKDWDWSKRPYRMNAIVAKNRRGPKGTAKLVFSPNMCRFDDWHMWKVKNAGEELKAGERQSVIDPQDVPGDQGEL